MPNSDRLIARLVDEAAIRDATARFADAGTFGNYDAFRDLWAEDGVYRDAPEAEVARADGSVPFREFIHSALPEADEATCDLTADLLERTLTDVGSSFSEVTRSDAEIIAYSDVMASMFCAYLGTLEGRGEAER